jgi:uncharacterized protein YndB with AHSA1/START domain
MSDQVIPDVRKSVSVPVSAEEAFRVFAERALEWWPATHRLVADRDAIVFEPWVGGRWFERGAGGSERDWGRVLAWEPPHRLVVSWRINGRWQPIDDDERASEIDVTFSSTGPDTTAVELAHVKLHRHGADATAIHRAIAGPSPGETLASYARVVAAVARDAVAG